MADPSPRARAFAVTIWPSHPDAVRSIAMAEVGAAAARLADPSAVTAARLTQLAAAEPLAPEPLLVAAALAQRRGETRRAELLLVQARARDPRSPAARYLLADTYFRSGRVERGLAELSILARLVPGGFDQIVPALATYAGNPGTLPAIQRMLRAYPDLEPKLLDRLAEDPGNARLILSLYRPRPAGSRAPEWPPKLLDRMIAAQDYAGAHAVWAKVSGVAAAPGLFNPRFQAVPAPPPFNWKLEAGERGVAEPAAGGLKVLHFGRDPTALASQTLLLTPGRYRLSMMVTGQIAPAAKLRWTVLCLPTGRELFRLGLGRGGIAGVFAVPPGCPAQRIELVGEASELPQSSDFRIGDLALEKAS